MPDPADRPRLLALAALTAGFVAALVVLAGTVFGGDPERKNADRAAEGVPAAVKPKPPAPKPVPEAQRDRPVPILMYHLVAEPPPGAGFPGLYVSEPDFQAQMDWLNQNGYKAVTLQRAYDLWTRGTPLPKQPVVVSFDDGYRSVHANAAPVLRRFKWPGVLNLELKVLGQQDQGGMSRRQVGDLLKAGWELDSHTISHPDLTTLPPDRLREELVESRARIKLLFGRPANFFCYPAGRYNQEVIAAVKAAGYLGATTTNPGNAGPDQLYAMNRVRVDRADGLDGFVRKMTALRDAGVAPAPESFTGGGAEPAG